MSDPTEEIYRVIWETVWDDGKVNPHPAKVKFYQSKEQLQREIKSRAPRYGSMFYERPNMITRFVRSEPQDIKDIFA